MNLRLGQSLMRRSLGLGIILLILTLIGIRFDRVPLEHQYGQIQQLSTINQSTSYLELSLINQETGQRGYDMTGIPAFLEPFTSGTKQFQTAAQRLSSESIPYPTLQQPIERVIDAGIFWHRHYGAPQVQQRQLGHLVSVASLKAGKSQLDRFRRTSFHLHHAITGLESYSALRLAHTTDAVLGLVVLMIIATFTIVLIWLKHELQRWNTPLDALIQAIQAYSLGKLDTPLTLPERSDLLPLFESLEHMRRAIGAQLQHYDALARYDPLTQILNRRSFEEDATRLKANPNSQPLSFIMIDIDWFKLVNDHQGHAAADAVSQQIAQTLAKESRADDLVCRFGGEEFLLALPRTDHPDALRQAERIRRTVQARVTEPRAVTISLGVSTNHLDESLDTVIKRADTALYHAKKQGKNRVASGKS